MFPRAGAGPRATVNPNRSMFSGGPRAKFPGVHIWRVPGFTARGSGEYAIPAEVSKKYENPWRIPEEALFTARNLESRSYGDPVGVPDTVIRSLTSRSPLPARSEKATRPDGEEPFPPGVHPSTSSRPAHPSVYPDSARKSGPWTSMRQNRKYDNRNASPRWAATSSVRVSGPELTGRNVIPATRLIALKITEVCMARGRSGYSSAERYSMPLYRYTRIRRGTVVDWPTANWDRRSPANSSGPPPSRNTAVRTPVETFTRSRRGTVSATQIFLPPGISTHTQDIVS